MGLIEPCPLRAYSLDIHVGLPTFDFNHLFDIFIKIYTSVNKDLLN